MTRSDRFFLVTVLGGRLHPDGVPDWGPWDSSRLHWWPEYHVDLVLTTTRERRVRTTEELEAAKREPMNTAPTWNMWIHESLEAAQAMVDRCGEEHGLSIA